MPAVITCTSCQSRLTMPAVGAGNQVQCPRCGAVFTAPPAQADEAIAAAEPGAPVSPVPPTTTAPASDQIQPAATETPGKTTPPANDTSAADESDYFEPGNDLPAELPGKARAILTMAALGISILGAIALAGVAVVASDVAEPPDIAFLLIPRPIEPPAVADKRATCRFLIDTLMRINLAMALASGIFFLVWFYNAHDNLRYLGAQNLQFTPGWAVGVFFVPILNLFRPYMAAQEIYRASSPDVSQDRLGFLGGRDIFDVHTARSASISTIINWWWALCLIRLLAGGCGGGFRNFERRRTVLTSGYLTEIVFVGALTILLSALTIALIKEIRDRQTRRFEKVLVAMARQSSRLVGEIPLP